MLSQYTSIILHEFVQCKYISGVSVCIFFFIFTTVQFIQVFKNLYYSKIRHNVWSARNLIPPKWQLESKFSSTSHVGFWVLFSKYMANRWRCLAIASPQVSLSTMLEWNKASLSMPDITILLITTSLPSNTAETYFHLRYWIIMIMGKMSYSYSTLCKANVHYCKKTSVICQLEHFFSSVLVQIIRWSILFNALHCTAYRISKQGK